MSMFCIRQCFKNSDHMMELPKKAFEILFFAVLFQLHIQLSHCLGNGTEFLCIEAEKQSLLTFKKSLSDPANLLSSWDTERDCCKWEKVVCDGSTGHVLELRLQSPGWNSRLEGEIDPSLLNLKFLRFLDLSQNNFDGISIPDLFGSLVSLEHLNLSSCGFQGTIPSLGNLSSLRSLGLGQTYILQQMLEFEGRLPLSANSLQWLSNLTHLQYLDLSYVNLSKVHDWLDIMNMLPSLIELHLPGCSLDNFSPIDGPNFSSLVVLELSRNSFSSLVPDWIFSLAGLESLQLQENLFEGPIPNATYGLANLRLLDLSLNKLNSTIPDWIFGCHNLESLSLKVNFFYGPISHEIVNLRSLRKLDLYGNMLSGQIPTEVGKLCNLQYLELSENDFEGNISEVFGMSQCFSTTIEELGVGGNRLSGLLPEQLGEFKNLQLLSLSNNLFTGSIPASLGNLSFIQTMEFEGNKLTGNFPQSFGQLSTLRTLSMGNNKLQGIVSENHFTNMTNLLIFTASRNPLTLKVNQDWIPPFQLMAIFLNSWNLGPQIPTWIQTQRNLEQLDLGSTGISGEIPTWFWNLSGMDAVNISHNELHGQLPGVIGRSWNKIYLSSNKFRGPLPIISFTVSEIDLSNNSFSGGISRSLCNESRYQSFLRILHLGGNQLSGEIPDCWTNFPMLKFIHLGNNNMSGTIPRSLGMLEKLSSLNLFGNSLSGPIPSALQNCSLLKKIDLSGNNISGKFPGWIGTSLSSLKILTMHSNSFTGEIPPEICQLNYLHILDLASNYFSGSIPNCLNNLTALTSETKLMNVSSTEITSYSAFTGTFMESALVTTKGRELEYDTILSQFSTIDLSNNKLSGEIPTKITDLAGLRSLNLSRNALSGTIPKNIGNMRVLESLDLSRNHISGEMPNSLSSLTFLSYLNLSYNNLTGRIPLGAQLQSLTEFSFAGNDLCGPPLKNTCAADGKTLIPGTEEHYAGPEPQVDWFYVFMALGFATGFGAFCTAFLYKRSWRNAYFQFLDEKFLNKLGVS